MVISESNINNIMGGIEATGGVRLHNHRKKLKQRYVLIRLSMFYNSPFFHSDTPLMSVFNMSLRQGYQVYKM